MSDNSFYADFAQRIEESFAEIEDEAIADFRKTDEAYANLYQQITELKAAIRLSARLWTAAAKFL